MHETVDLVTVQGKKLFRVFSAPDSECRNLVIMLHGFKGNSVGASRSYVNFTNLLVANQIAVLRFDQPCSGNSQGDFIDSSFNEWVDACVYFAKYYIEQGYRVAFLGHSMGADTAVVAALRDELHSQIPLLLLWAPDPKSEPTDWFLKDAQLIDEKQQIFEEGGQQFRASFWQEVYEANFFHCLQQYSGQIHLVYGENDRFVSENLRKQVIQAVRDKQQPVMILKDQDHLMWKMAVCQQVFQAELALLKKTFAL